MASEAAMLRPAHAHAALGAEAHLNLPRASCGVAASMREWYESDPPERVPLGDLLAAATSAARAVIGRELRASDGAAGALLRGDSIYPMDCRTAPTLGEVRSARSRHGRERERAPLPPTRLPSRPRRARAPFRPPRRTPCAPAPPRRAARARARAVRARARASARARSLAPLLPLLHPPPSRRAVPAWRPASDDRIAAWEEEAAGWGGGRAVGAAMRGAAREAGGGAPYTQTNKRARALFPPGALRNARPARFASWRVMARARSRGPRKRTEKK